MTDVFLMTGDDAFKFAKSLFECIKFFKRCLVPIVRIDGYNWLGTYPSYAIEETRFNAAVSGCYQLNGVQSNKRTKCFADFYDVLEKYGHKPAFFVDVNQYYDYMNAIIKEKQLGFIKEIRFFNGNINHPGTFNSLTIVSETRPSYTAMVPNFPIDTPHLSTFGPEMKKYTDPKRTHVKRLIPSEVQQILQSPVPVEYEIKNVGKYTISKNVIPKEFEHAPYVYQVISFNTLTNVYELNLGAGIGLCPNFIMCATTNMLIIPDDFESPLVKRGENSGQTQ